MNITSKRWACAKYSPKKMGVGVAGSGAFMMIQGVHADIDDLHEVIRLVVAAPDLLEAAKEALEMLELDGNHLGNAGIKCRSAIAKAMGLAV